MKNPYNLKPGNLFVGQEELLEALKNGLQNSSFAVGGRRVGKTSLLRQLEKELRKKDHFQPCFLSMMEFTQLTPNRFFERIYRLLSQEGETTSDSRGTPNRLIKTIHRWWNHEESFSPKWKEGKEGSEYENFRLHLKKIQFEKQEGIVVLLIDELDNAKDKLNQTFFQNLRDLFMDSEFASRLKLVATGVKDLSDLIETGSPFNFLTCLYLGVLDDESAQKLIGFGFPSSFPEEGLEKEVLALTGKHPCLMQWLLGKMWEKSVPGKIEELKKTSRNYYRERPKDFESWWNMFSPDERELYQSIANGGSSSLTRLEKEEALIVLSYHGVVNNNDPDSSQVFGTMFRDWFFMKLEKEERRERKQIKQEGEEYDVFLCHNSQDKPKVKEIGEQLKEKGLRVWLDEWILRPGFPWQMLLDQQIKKIKSAAVFLGENGIGPWQQEEIYSFLSQFKERKCPVIPVILEKVDSLPEDVPSFLKERTFVDFRKPDPDPLRQLILGITGERVIEEAGRKN